MSINITIDNAGIENRPQIIFKPNDYGINHEDWRPGQAEAVMELHAGGSGKKYIFLEAETGTGKSALAASFQATKLGVTALTVTHSLMAQYSDIYEFTPLYGKQVYTCAAHGDIAGGMKIYADACTEKVMSQCPFANECPYLVAKAECIRSKKRCLTVHYAVKHPQWMIEHPTSILFVDEAHRLPELIMGAYELILTKGWYKQNELPPLELSDNSVLRIIQFSNWLRTGISLLAENIKALRATKDVHDSRKATRLERTQSHLMMIFKGFSDNQKDFVILPYEQKNNRATQLDMGMGNSEQSDRGDVRNIKEWHIAPLTAAPFTKYALGMEMYEKVIFSSATIGNPKVLAKALGLGDNEWEHIQVESQFEPQQMPVLIPEGAPKISYGMSNKTRQEWFDLMYKILTQKRTMSDGSKLALIHTSSKAMAFDILKGLKQRGIQNKNIWIPEEHLTTKEKFEEFKRRTKNNKNLITISWAFHEGLDAPEVFLNIIAKVPFASLSTLGKLRKEHHPAAYIQNAANGVQQAAGRQRRGKTEHYENLRVIGMNRDLTLDGMERQCWVLDRASMTSYIRAYYTERFKTRFVRVELEKI